MPSTKPPLPDSAIPDYDQLWDEVYGDIQDVGPVHRHMKRLMRKILAPLQYDSVLDVGVGFGHNLPILTEGRPEVRVAGVDFSERALAHVRQRWPGEFTHLDVERDSLHEQFDLVCVSLVMEHVIDDAAVLRHLRSMTGRYLLIVTIGGDFERYMPWESQMGHVRNYRRNELEGKLERSGFAVREMIYWGFPFYNPFARTLQNHMTASHNFKRSARWIAKFLYPLYFLNSSRRGDLLVALADAA